MSEEIKNIEDLLDVFEHTDGIYYLGDYSNITIANFIRNLQQKVEQLEKENKELKQQELCKTYDERLFSLKLRANQLENIRKEAIEYIKFYTERLLNSDISITPLETEHLLNILNKGSDYY